MQLTIRSIPGFPIWGDGQARDLGAEIIDCLERAPISVDDGDVLVIAHKIVSKAEGRVVELKSVTPRPEAVALAARTAKDPRLVEVILRESREVLRVAHNLIITEHRLGFICANAGVDQSNCGDPNDRRVVLLPEDPDRSARVIRDALRARYGTNVGVLIADTHGRAFRQGIVGVCIGLAGVPALLDLRGRKDLFGYTLRASIECVADELAAAATLIMGQADEGTPLVLVKGFSLTARDDSARAILRDKQHDLFR